MDAHKNFAISTVVTAPSPATSGTSIVVTGGEGARFPAVPFNATIWPTSLQPDPLTAEIVRVTARSTDTLTITRAQEGSTARTVVIGDRIAAGITAKTLTDLETPSFNTQTASYTLVLADGGNTVEMNVASANVLTVPLNSSVAFAIGVAIVVRQYGAGQTTITPVGGVTLRSRGAAYKLSGQYSEAILTKRATDEWVVSGDVTT